MIKRAIQSMSILLALCLPVSAHSQVSQELSNCLTDSLNGKERKQLAQWIFFGMSVHPELTAYSNVSPEVRNETDQTIGALITRLMTENCSAETISAIKNGGSSAIQSAFEVVGAVAMQELMADQSVSGSLSGFERFLDQEKFEKLGGN